MTIAAIVPARSGSKRLPGKNIKPLAGKPLVLWTLEACVTAPSIDKVIFSTDSDEYWNLACEQLGEEKLVLDRRTSDEAGDKVRIFDYLKGARDKIFASEDETFLLALPTAPFRRAEHIEEAVALSKERGKPVFSVTEYGSPISFALYVNDDGSWEPASEPSPLETGNTRSQDQRAAYHPNGAIYMRTVADLANPDLNTFFQGAIPYLMDRDFSIDIDNEIDFIVAAAMVEAGVLG